MSSTPKRTTKKRAKMNLTTKKKEVAKSHEGSNNNEMYFGKSVIRQFEGQNRTGTVERYISKKEQWHITYDNGVGEDVKHGELLLGLDEFNGTKDSAHVGRTRVTRKFNSRPFDGIVDSFDEKERLWHIAFDDGDEEELDHIELLIAQDLYVRIHGRQQKPSDELLLVKKESSSEMKDEKLDEKSIHTIPKIAFSAIPILVAAVAIIFWCYM